MVEGVGLGLKAWGWTLNPSMSPVDGCAQEEQEYRWKQRDVGWDAGCKREEARKTRCARPSKC